MRSNSCRRTSPVLPCISVPGSPSWPTRAKCGYHERSRTWSPGRALLSTTGASTSSKAWPARGNCSAPAPERPPTTGSFASRAVGSLPLGIAIEWRLSPVRVGVDAALTMLRSGVSIPPSRRPHLIRTFRSGWPRSRVLPGLRPSAQRPCHFPIGRNRPRRDRVGRAPR